MKRLNFCKPVTRRLTPGSNYYSNPNTNPTRPSRHVTWTAGRSPGGNYWREAPGDHRGKLPGKITWGKSPGGSSPTSEPANRPNTSVVVNAILRSWINNWIGRLVTAFLRTMTEWRKPSSDLVDHKSINATWLLFNDNVSYERCRPPPRSRLGTGYWIYQCHELNDVLYHRCSLCDSATGDARTMHSLFFLFFGDGPHACEGSGSRCRGNSRVFIDVIDVKGRRVKEQREDGAFGNKWNRRRWRDWDEELRMGERNKNNVEYKETEEVVKSRRQWIGKRTLIQNKRTVQSPITFRNVTSC